MPIPGAEISALADDSAAAEQSIGAGVYITMFEQSMLTEKRTNKPWSFFASLSLELVGISLLVIIPLITGDHLPHFSWKAVTLGAPVRQLEQPKTAPTRSHSNQPSLRPTVIHRPFDPALILFRKSPSESSSPESLDISGLIPTSGVVGMPFNPVGEQIGKSIVNLPTPRPAEKPQPRQQTGPIRVSEGVQMAKLIRKVVPMYPILAKQTRVSGVVRLIGIIGRDGTIRNLQLVSGHPLLTKAAIDAVQQWVYQPTLLSGEAVEVIAPIDVIFTLSQ